MSEKFKRKSEVVSATTEGRRRKEATAVGARSWDTYNSDTYQLTFNELIDIDTLRSKILDMKKDGSTVVGIDLMGQGKPGLEVGCDSVIALTLDSANEDADKELVVNMKSLNIEPILGDIFKLDTASRLLELAQQKSDNGEKLGVIYFRPLGGLEAKNLQAFDYMYAFLFLHYLKPLYRMLEPQGVILVDLTAYDNNKTKELIEGRVAKLPEAEVTFADSVTRFMITKGSKA